VAGASDDVEGRNFMPQRYRRIAIWLAILCAVLTIGAWGWREMNVRPMRRALPSTATDIHEFDRSDGFLPDYSYYLKARISSDEFQTYVERRHLKPFSEDGQYDESPHPWVNWRSQGQLGEGSWWNPSVSLDGTYVANSGDEWILAKYEHGYIYVRAIEH
jgi:hypothetical protein